MTLNILRYFSEVIKRMPEIFVQNFSLIATELTMMYSLACITTPNGPLNVAPPCVQSAHRNGGANLSVVLNDINRHNPGNNRTIQTIMTCHNPTATGLATNGGAAWVEASGCRERGTWTGVISC